MDTVMAARVPQSYAIDLLGDADPDIRLEAAHEIGRHRLEGAATPLVDRFGRERDFLLREALTWAALRIREAAMPLVRNALGAASWLARLQAAHTVSKLGVRDDGPRLLDLIGDPIDAVAERAYSAAAQCRHPGVVPGLAANLGRGNSSHRNSLTVALAHFGRESIPALVASVALHADPAARRHAADTLAEIGSPAAEPAALVLQDATADPDRDVRIAALNALGYLATAAAWSHIDDVRATGDGVLALLARRLQERRPSELLPTVSAIVPERANIAAAPMLPPPPAHDLVTVDGGPWAAELVPKLALQVAVSAPRFRSRADVPAGVLRGVWRRALEAALAVQKPRYLAERIAAGAVEEFIHHTVFLEQVLVADPGMTVADLLRGTEVKITDFATRET